MGLNEYKSGYQEVVNAIKTLNIDKFQAYTNNIVIDFQEIPDGGIEKNPKSLLDNLTVMLKAKNRDPYLQSLFVSRIWEMFSSNKEQSKLLNLVALDLLPLLFLRERNEKNLFEQVDLFFKLLDSEPHDVFLLKVPSMVNLFQNPFFNNIDVVLKHLSNRKNGFDFIGHLKVKEQCYYQKEMLLSLLNYLIEHKSNLSIDAIYKACNNITISSVCHCRGELEITWTSYSPKEIQNRLETLLLNRLSLDDVYRRFIPFVLASKNFRELSYQGNNLKDNYLSYLSVGINEFYDNCDSCEDKEDLFKILKRLNIPQESYVCLEGKHLLEMKLASLDSIDCSDVEMVEFQCGKL